MGLNTLSRLARPLGLGGIVGVVGIGTDLYMGYDTYKENKEEGKSELASTALGLGTIAAWQMAPSLMLAKTAIDMGSAIAQASTITGQRNSSFVNSQYKANFGGSYQDTQMSATMRQAGVGNISQSRQNTRNALGNEAKSYYRR